MSRLFYWWTFGENKQIVGFKDNSYEEEFCSFKIFMNIFHTHKILIVYIGCNLN